MSLPIRPVASSLTPVAVAPLSQVNDATGQVHNKINSFFGYVHTFRMNFFIKK